MKFIYGTYLTFLLGKEKNRTPHKNKNKKGAS